MTRSACLALACLLFAAGCGVEGGPRPPEGEEALYSYPNPYPAPRTGVPGGRAEDRAGARLPPPRTRTIEPVE